MPSRFRLPSAALLVASLLLAGCLTPESEPARRDEVQEDEAARLARIQASLAEELAMLPCDGVEHVRGQTSANYLQIAELAWPDESGHGEIEVLHGTNLVFVSRYGSGGFEVVDVTDPFHPEHRLSFPVEGSYSLDIKISRDGLTLLEGTFGAITLVDISDPLAPILGKRVPFPDAFRSTSAQAHMLHVAEIGDAEYVFAASQIAHGVLIFKLVGEPDDRDLEFLTVFAPATGGPLAVHDMMVMQDPVENKPLLWVANGFGGFVVGDVSDPAMPILVAAGPPYDPYLGYTHTVSVAFYDGKRIAATVAELGAMALKVYDVTNLQAPILLGTWTYDSMPTAVQHNTQILKDWLFMGHYGEGFLQFNLSEIAADAGTLPAYNVGPIAGALGDAIQPHSQFQPEFGSVWEVIVVNGVHYVSRMGAGAPLLVVMNGCLPAGDAEATAYT